MDTRTEVRQFILTNFYVPPGETLEDSASLLDSGLVDSTGILEVISFIESHFGIKVADSEMLPENLDSVTRITRYVERKKAPQG